MRLSRSSMIIATVALAYFASLAVVVTAAEENERAMSGVPVPTIPRGQGESCVEDTDFMRRSHMTLLLHQRDDTVVQGIRSKRYSLKECVSCHAVQGADARAVTVSSPQHFCRSCHDYAAVKIDCFQCHASRPDVDADAGHHDDLIAEMQRK